jgi:hypothetical protein
MAVWVKCENGAFFCDPVLKFSAGEVSFDTQSGIITTAYAPEILLAMNGIRYANLTKHGNIYRFKLIGPIPWTEYFFTQYQDDTYVRINDVVFPEAAYPSRYQKYNDFQI